TEERARSKTGGLFGPPGGAAAQRLRGLPFVLGFFKLKKRPPPPPPPPRHSASKTRVNALKAGRAATAAYGPTSLVNTWLLHRSGKQAEFWPQRLFSFELRRREDATAEQALLGFAPGFSLRRRPNFLVVVHRVVPAKLATCKSDGFILSGKRSHWLAARAHDPSCPC